MIATLTGSVSHLSADSVVVQAGAVGYEVTVTPQLQSDLLSKPQHVHTLWIGTIVREDALLLFGFATWSERAFFYSLLKVNGVGPRMALNVLSGGSLHEVQGWIETEDIKALSKIPKVGKKTAEQMVLTLKGKLPSAHAPQANRESEWRRDVKSILTNLGFKLADIEIVAQDWNEGMDLNEAVRVSLQKLSAGGGTRVY